MEPEMQNAPTALVKQRSSKKYLVAMTLIFLVVAFLFFLFGTRAPVSEEQFAPPVPLTSEEKLEILAGLATSTPLATEDEKLAVLEELSKDQGPGPTQEEKFDILKSLQQ